MQATYYLISHFIAHRVCNLIEYLHIHSVDIIVTWKII